MRARGLTVLVVAAAALAGAAGCSVLLDWNSLAGQGDGGLAGDAPVAEGSADSQPLTHCSSPLQCVTAPPAGWTGPVELYVAQNAQGGSAPSCGSGFATIPAFDGQGGTLTAPAATCTACACSGPTGGVTCAGPVMSFFADDKCNTPFGNPVTVSGSCATTPIGAFSTTVAAPQPTGGSCAASGGVASTTPPTWEQLARACSGAVPSGQADCNAGQVCAPVPSSPFATQLCVMQPGAAASCPPEYPQGPQVFYAGVDDKRGCSACVCAGPSGGSCTIANPAIEACTPPGGTWSSPGACATITGPQPVRLASGSTPTLVDAGSCALADGGAPTGQATGTGGTTFCCAQ